MAAHAGKDGRLSTGGDVAGTPVLDGAVAANATMATLEGDGASLYGVILAGDRFTVGMGMTIHTVSRDVVITSGSATIQFEPASPGWANGAEIKFIPNVVIEARDWSLTVTREMADVTRLGSQGKQWLPLTNDWSGTFNASLDLGDPNQRKILNNLTSDTPSTYGISLIADDGKLFYGITHSESGTVTNQKGDAIVASFNFKSADNMHEEWRS